MKGWWLIFIAAAIDGLQALVALGLSGLVSPIALIGQFVPFIGQLIGTTLIFSGMLVGFVVDVFISLTIGSALLYLMAINGYFVWRLIPAFIGEGIPGLDFLPLWTGVVAWAVYSKNKQNAQKKRQKNPEPAIEQATAPVAPQRATTPARARVGQEVGAALALLLLFAAAPSARAQAIPAPIQYVVTPEVPGLHEQVTIEVQGVGSFLGDATLTWTQDNRVVRQGVGARSYTFVTGAAGQATTIGVSIDSSQGAFSKTFTFNPAKVNLVWEADTTVPPLYKGRALYSAGSTYRVVAFPTVYSGGAKVAPSALSYQWSYKGDALPDDSGLGRNALVRTGDQLQSGENIGLDVFYGNVQVATAALTIGVTDPMILFYERDALRGTIYDTALPSAIGLQAKEITLQAQPYYFSNTQFSSGQAPFVWTLNGQETSGPDSAQGVLTLRQSGQGAGVASIGVSIQNTNPDQFIQTARATIQIAFGASGNALLNLFGL